MKAVSKTLIACAVAAASLFAANAGAATFNPFTVQPTGPSTVAPFTADKITGNYQEVVTFNPDGTFSASLFFSAGQFVAAGGTGPLTSKQTGLGFDYGVYATYNGTGTVTTSGSATKFTFNSGSGTLAMYLDRNTDTTATAPGSGSGAFVLNNSSDDLLLATGIPLDGLGTLDPSLPTCGGGGINCGSFGSATTFALTAFGTTFFTAPNPFYDLSFQSGQLNNFQTSGTQTINGSLDVVFGRVPEPASVGLLGLGMLALGFSRRRKQS